MLDPAGTDARMIGRIGSIMYGGAAAIFALVAALTLWALFAPERRRGWLGSRNAVIAGGIVLPVVVLSALLVYGLAIAGNLVGPSATEPLRVQVVGERWWWRIHYLGEDGEIALVSANEIRIPTGRPVEFILVTADLIHSFWVPNLGGKRDMIPGRENRIVFTAERAGIYRGQCAEYCGAQHAHMAFDVVAHEPAEFERWLAAQRQPAIPPADEWLARGQRIFRENGCGGCHTLRGTEAAGAIGPDLTHVGGRLSLAAGTLANNPGTLAAWVAHAQEIKPGNLMPAFAVIAPEDLRALAAYLESLQ